MSYLLEAVLGGLILGGAAWASNIWPGIENWWRAAVSRALWWGLPFGLIALECDVPMGHAAILGAAAWVGSWIPHTAMPDVRSHLVEMLTDLAVVLLRVAALLSVPTAVFWTCGAFWSGMLMAVAGALPAVLLANTPIGDVDLPGLRTRRQVAGVLFGISTGIWVALSILIPDPLTDHLL